MRELLIVTALVAATSYAQDRVEARKAVVHVQAVDRAFERVQQLRKRGVGAVPRSLRVHQPYTVEATGIVISPKGEILTAALHPRADLRITVTFQDGLDLEANMIGTDPRSHLALVRVPIETRHYLQLGKEPPARNDSVLVVGHPKNAPRQQVAAVGRVGLVEVPVTTQDHYGVTPDREIRLADVFFVATLANRGPQTWGSACIDANRRLCGVVVGDTPQRSLQVHAVLPVSRIARIVRDLRAHGRVIRADFGLKLAPASETLREQLQLPASACSVRWLDRNGPAHRAGVKRHDIVLNVDGVMFADSYKLVEAMADKQPGKATKLDILRAGRQLTVQATPVELK